jgi:hypothetical protein
MLKPLIYGGQPYGIFDNLDSNVTLGGEVATLTGVPVTGSDKHARDIDDGYTTTAGPNSFTRPAATCVLTGSEGGFVFLTDDGISGYGTLFGTMIGTAAGTVQDNSYTFGPPSYAGSGKMTLWNNPGLYGITLDALHPNFNYNSPSLAVGTPVFYAANGKLCLTADKVSGAPAVGHFIEFTAGDTLVSTPNSFARSGMNGKGIGLKYAVINWRPRSA